MGSIIKYLFHYLHCSVRILVSDSSMEMMATWTKKVNCARDGGRGAAVQSPVQCSAVCVGFFYGVGTRRCLPLPPHVTCPCLSADDDGCESLHRSHPSCISSLQENMFMMISDHRSDDLLRVNSSTN
jgi:hypothetical protein